jgi:hypothetical protein
MWTVEDNGQEITWPQAKAYANHLRIGGYSDWRLPEMYELKKLHDPMGGNRYNVRKPFRLTGYCVWSSTTHGSDGLPFDFDLGGRALWRVVAAGVARALSVRRFGE